MHSQIKESELELMEFMSDPTALTECLIPENLNTPQAWPNCKCVVLRPYQFAMQNYSYLISDDPELKIEDNFVFKKLAGDLYSIGSRNTGKCEYIENECQLADGSLKKFKDLINTQQSVISFNEISGKLEIAKALFKDNGFQPCYKIVTASGKEIIVTSNHPLYTENGWIKAENIDNNNFLATPRKINISGKKVDNNLAKLIGYLLGDGGCTGNIGITNINSELIKEFYELADYFDCKIRKYNVSYFFSKKEIPRKQRGQNKKNNIQKIVEKYDLKCLSKEKFINNEIFKWSNGSIALLLNRLFACDGSINIRNSYPVIEICLASKKLIYQIQTLLLRFGIHSNVLYKKVKYNNSFKDAWRLYIDSDSMLFLKTIGIKSKDENIKYRKSFSSSDLIPKEIVNKYREEIQYPTKYGIDNIRKYGYSRLKLQKLLTKNDSVNLYKDIHNDIYWDLIKSVDFVGMLSTVMVSVEKNHTYISNNIISHNSFFLIIDVVLSFIKKCKEGCVASVTAEKLQKVTRPICKFIEAHKFCKIFHLRKETTRSKTVLKNPLTINSEHGCAILSVNEKIDSDDPGVLFHSKHYDIRWTEEAHYSTKEGQEKAEDAEMSYGHIERPSGIPDLCVDSPLEKFLKDKKMKNFIWRLPQYVRADWTEEIEERKAKKYNGRNSAGYLLNVEAKIMEGAFNFFDMARLKEKSFRKSGRVKFFEIGKESYAGFENRLHIERLAGSEQIYICADIGTGSAPTEIIIVFFDGKKYKYVYNISLYRLIQDEQAEIFYWLFEKLEGAFIAIDATHDGGVIIDMLRKKGIDSDYLLKVKFNENIDVDFKRDKDDKPLMDNNNEPIMKQAYTETWSFSELEKILYSGEFESPLDPKFEEQFTNIICKRTKMRTLFDSKAENHLVQAFQVFAICRFFNKFNILRREHKKAKRAYCSFTQKR